MTTSDRPDPAQAGPAAGRPAAAEHPAQPGRVIVVPCGARKLDRPCSAGELYIGSFHRAARRAAAALSRPGDTTLIISARFGLVALDDPVVPYEQRIGHPGAITGPDVIRQVHDRGLDGAGAVLLTPAPYTRILYQAWPAATAVLAGTRGIGEQMAILAAIATGRRDITPPGQET